MIEKVYNYDVSDKGVVERIIDEKDISIAESIATLMHHKVVILTGKTTLKQFGALCKRAGLVISADSGPLHIACAVGARVIGLFGPTSPKITGPRGPHCKVIWKDVGCKVPCYDQRCKHYKCMEAITVDDVLKEI